jgi:hypothetical protein
VLRELETSTKVVVSFILVVVGVGLVLVTSRWTVDWIGHPRYRATIASCPVVYEVAEKPRRCYADTSKGPLYIYGAGQHNIGDHVTFIWTTHKITNQPPGVAIAFAPAIADYVLLALAVDSATAGLVGFAVLIGRKAHRRVRSRNSEEAMLLSPQ